MRKNSGKPLPFGIVRKCGKSLVDQTVDGFKDAILSGYYCAGDFLPSFGEIARQLNVSMRVPTEAVRLLVSSGFVVSRPRIGSEVMPRRGCVWKGDVLLVLPAEYEYAYFVATLIGEMRKQLSSAGYLVDTVVYDMVGGQPNLQTLERKLDRHIDMAFLVYAGSQVAKRFVAKGVPYFCVSRNPYVMSHAVRVLTLSTRKLVKDLLTRLKKLGVKDILVLNVDGYKEIEDGLKAAGFRVETIGILNRGGFGYAEAIQREAMSRVEKRFSTRRKRKPDVVLITDDVVAKGALLAMSFLGVAIPEDVRVVTFSNVGNAPIYRCSLAVMENDPRENARLLVSAMLSPRDGSVPAAPKIESPLRFRDGASLDR